MARERAEILRKESMAEMFLKKENATFWETPSDSIVASSEKFFIDPEVLQVITDLDNQLIGRFHSFFSDKTAFLLFLSSLSFILFLFLSRL